VRQKAFEMGEIAIQMLLKLIESKYPVYEFETRRLDAKIYWHEPEK
jgi:LacI family transcriptional regulator